MGMNDSTAFRLILKWKISESWIIHDTSRRMLQKDLCVFQNAVVRWTHQVTTQYSNSVHYLEPMSFMTRWIKTYFKLLIIRLCVITLESCFPIWCVLINLARIATVNQQNAESRDQFYVVLIFSAFFTFIAIIISIKLRKHMHMTYYNICTFIEWGVSL